MNRIWHFDALRGLMLVLMTLTHLPTRLTAPFSQPFGYVSAAEGFVLLSAYMAGWVYGGRGLRQGPEAMRRALVRRSLKVYLCHMALIVFAFTVVALIAQATRQEAATGLLSFYFEAPLTAWIGAVLMIYMPPLLDILPLYVLFLLLSPLVLAGAARAGWTAVLAASGLCWLAAQWGLGSWLYQQLVVMFGGTIGVQHTGSFSIWAWQLLWVVGLWLGVGTAMRQGEDRKPFSPAVVALAVLVASVFLVWRYVAGPSPLAPGNMWNLLFDKWRLGPLRLLNLTAIVVVVMHFGPGLVQGLRQPVYFTKLGQASLQVFCAHLVAILAILAIWGGEDVDRSPLTDVILVVFTLAALYAVAAITVRARGRKKVGTVKVSEMAVQQQRPAHPC
ncbi:hypothetical protein AAV94_00375 [Lampropedia cohaerens]|uniref:Acyltransferase n=1 Tax=Lampropedia cohaerens TaxID=1610491 RepID=A0A0U1Q3J9_9BURK|nr:OpgC domain-containing protein [Lampropedia cohaerens]KKW69314.1 hypothetical protein AAV94_00375 [Lampropedia cohaerens]